MALLLPIINACIMPEEFVPPDILYIQYMTLDGIEHPQMCPQDSYSIHLHQPRLIVFGFVHYKISYGIL